ncbi:L-histidine N(alpha)-methyltransferase [Chloroflexota bacterium]
MVYGKNQNVAGDFLPGREQFLFEVLSRLRKSQKELPTKYFYDEHGSHLFESICSLDEYYIPDTEESIMLTHISEIVGLIGPKVLLIEYGSGNCQKIRFLLDNLIDPTAYVPIDISQEQLLNVTGEVAADYPDLELLPVCADYTNSFKIPAAIGKYNRTVVYFPGSTIGNFHPVMARQFLEHIAQVCGTDGALLIGVDLKKDPTVLHSAYNDAQGVTSAFNLNLLKRINRELGSDFQVDSFRHYAFYNPTEGRIEMHLISMKEQGVNLNGETIYFKEGETIWTESSYKYTLEEFEEIANATGFRVRRTWTDERQWFSVQYLETTVE